MPVDEADAAEHQHEDQEAGRAERAVRREHGRKDRGVRLRVGACCRLLMGLTIREPWRARHHASWHARRPARRRDERRKNAVARRAQASRQPSKPASKRVAADKQGRRRRAAAMDAGRDRGSVPPLPGRQVRSRDGELEHINPFTLLVAVVLSAQATDAGRQQGDPGAVRGRRHARQDGGARRGAGARADQDHRPVPHQGEERHRAVGEAHRASTAARCRATARRWRRCRASAARPPTWCSTSRSASRPSRSTPTSSASATAPGSRPARPRSRSREARTRWCPPKYKRHAHHWLILHGRYVCVARRPLCEQCLIADLCKWPGKTVARPSPSR